MLLRYRRTGLDAIFGPCYEQNPPPAGGAPAVDPAPPATGQPPAPPAGGAPPTGQPPEDRSGWIPRERFESQAQELRRFQEAEQKRRDDEAKARGDFEALNAAEKAKTAEAEERAVKIARRAAFISKAATKVADADAAYKLAAADGMLNDLKVNDEGDPDDPKAVDKIVDALIAKYEFLKGTDKSRSFGEPAGGNGGAPVDTSKMSGHDMLRAGFATPKSRHG
jgi:hypothetical protein